MTAQTMIEEIDRLQRVAAGNVEQALASLRTADELTRELKRSFGDRFVSCGKAYKFEHRAIGIGQGNRDWLVSDPSVSVIP